MGKYMNKYRQESFRAPWMDYASAGHYFVTINTKNRRRFFGDVKDGKMMLSEIGLIAVQEWQKTPDFRPDMNLSLGAFVVMPDHFHAVVSIGENVFNTNDDLFYKEDYSISAKFVTPNLDSQYSGLAPQMNNLSSIIRGFKSAVTTHSRKMDMQEFGWQKLYHDHIIRNQNEYNAITRYIQNNPKNWK
jgi:putative transposase